MIDIGGISKIGYGGYRISINTDENRNSLLYALNSGCNLIDTAPNYSNGNSELLIGKVVENYGKDVFLISKVGYMNPNNPFFSKALPKEDTTVVANDFKYSLNVDFIKYQLDHSIKNLKRSCLDGYLIHNPEYLYNSFKVEVDNKIKDKVLATAFSFLEEQVKKKRIRYYGVSSNTLPLPSDQQQVPNVSSLVKIASSIDQQHNLKIIQFPYNISEDYATSIFHCNDESLLTLCKKHNLMTIANRPLNILYKEKIYRMVSYKDDLRQLNEEHAVQNFNEFFTTIIDKLKDHGMDDQWQEFPVLVNLKSHWNQMGNPEAVQKLNRDFIVPFLNSLYEENINPRMNVIWNRLISDMILLSKRKITRDAEMLFTEFRETMPITNSSDNIVASLCSHYLSKGIDHVLVGMRKVKYVDDVKTLF